MRTRTNTTTPQADLHLLEPARVERLRAARRRPPRVLVAGGADNEASAYLGAAWHELGIDSELVSPLQTGARLSLGDIVLGRLDVLATLDGVEPGLYELLRLERRGIRVLNPASALLGAHDKLRTAHQLARVGLPHPRTTHLRAGEELPPLPGPLVVKPRFGSWGKDVFRCETAADLITCLEEIRARPWFRRHGALLQQLIPPRGYDLRVLVAGGTAVGAIERVAATGEWRTNISLGGSKRPCIPPAAGSALAVAAAAAIGADLVGVDLLPVGDSYVVVELNGAVEFDRDYSRPGADVYAEIADALGLLPAPTRSGHSGRVAIG